MMIRACLVSVLASSALVAADQTWSIDVRGHVGASSPMTEVDGDSVDGKMSLAWGVDAGFHRPLGEGNLGLVLLGGVFRDVHNAEENGTDLDYTVLGVNLAGGLSYKLMEPWHLEGLIHARLGTGDLDGTSNGTSVSGDRGTSSAFGVTAGAYYTFPFKLLVGGTVGYEFWQGESDVAGTTIDVEGDGLTFAVVAGYAF
jgi:hypothetical protein